MNKSKYKFVIILFSIYLFSNSCCSQVFIKKTLPLPYEVTMVNDNCDTISGNKSFLSVFFENTFQDDTIEVLFNDSIIFNGVITTIHSLGLAKAINFEIVNSNNLSQTLSIILNNELIINRMSIKCSIVRLNLIGNKIIATSTNTKPMYR